MKEFDINIGEINSGEVPYIFEGYPHNPNLKSEIEHYTYNISVEYGLGIPLEEALKENEIETKENKKHKRFGQEWMLENPNLLQQLNNNSYLPMITSGKVFSLFPDVQLQPSDKYFSFFFALRITRMDIFDIDDFLEYQLQKNFKGDDNKFKRFLTLCIREYSQSIFNTETIDTINEWISMPKNDSEKNVVKNTGSSPTEKPRERYGLKDIFHSIVEKDRVITLLKNHKHKDVPIIIATEQGYIINISGGKYKFLAALKEVLKKHGLLKTNDTTALAKAFCNEFNVSLSTKQFEDNYAQNEDIGKYLDLLKFLNNS